LSRHDSHGLFASVTYKHPGLPSKTVSFQALNHKGLQNREKRSLLLTMSRSATPVKEKVAAHRARQIAAGRIALTTYVPTDLLEQIDKIKEQRGAAGRGPIIEEALRLLIEKQQRA